MSSKQHKKNCICPICLSVRKELHKFDCECCACNSINGITWNAGLTKETDERVKRISDAMKGRKNSLGYVSWNKGLTKENSGGVLRISESKKGDKNPAKRFEVRRKKSKSMKKWYVTHEKPVMRPEVIMKFVGDKNPAKRPEVRDLISEGLRRAWANPKSGYNNPKSLRKMGAGVGGFFYSKKNMKKLYFQSSLELKHLKYMELDEDIISYDRGPSLLYMDFFGKIRTYNVDWKVVYEYNTKLIESKPRFFLEVGLDNFLHSLIPKLEALEEYCRENRMEYEYWTEVL